ncbi:MAG: hypothetical protein L3J29_10160 [Cyclobacteriaceae bacterium]|nr:hypothetical protein [Cyclobacteriaceae bacterium]
MEEESEKEIGLLKQKFFEFERMGLISYEKYLEKEFEFASKKKIRKYYKNYIISQLEMTAKKIEKLTKKLTSK